MWHHAAVDGDWKGPLDLVQAASYANREAGFENILFLKILWHNGHPRKLPATQSTVFSLLLAQSLTNAQVCRPVKL